MKKPHLKIMIHVLIAGILLTVLSAIEINWHRNSYISQNTNCFTSYNNQLPENIRSIDCSGREYGYPKRFLYVATRADLLQLTPDSNETLIGVTGRDKLDIKALVIDLVVWSGISLLLISSFRCIKCNMHKNKK